ncbi:MAG: hypothetical protein R3E67_04665 [Pseudomonadales bacterium]
MLALFYAVKAFRHAAIVNTLNQLGAGFDIASTGEINLLRKQKVNRATRFTRTQLKKIKIFAMRCVLVAALLWSITLVEIAKFRQYAHRVGLLLRVAFRSPDCAVDLSKKVWLFTRRSASHY